MNTLRFERTIFRVLPAGIPFWKAHRLTGDRKGTWALHVTRNWRLTFRIDGDEIADVDLEDYH